MNPKDVDRVLKAVDEHGEVIVALLQRLIRIPSVNHPPTGDEKAIQEFYCQHLRTMGLVTQIFEADELPEFADHPGRLREHCMKDRPDVVGVLTGAGGGRSLMLVAHADVELPGGKEQWSDRDAFSGALRDGRVYGRGAGDDKWGMAIMATVPRILATAGFRLHGDLLVCSVTDEEQAGSNGAVALVCKGYQADACLLLDGCNEAVFPANLGGGNCDIQLSVPSPQTDARPLLDYFDHFRRAIRRFGKRRERKFLKHRYYSQGLYPGRAVRLSNICLGTDDVTRGSFRVWFYLLPGERADDIQARFEACLSVSRGEGRFAVRWLSRFVPASEVDEAHPFVACLRDAFSTATGRPAEIHGGPMSDAGVLNPYGAYPCVAFGPGHMGKEGAVHLADEFITADELMSSLKTAVIAAMSWCGYSTGGTETA